MTIYSFIIPVYHGEKTIEPLFQAIHTSCKNNNLQFEVIFVWDCGPDNSWDVITDLKNKYPDFIKGIRLSRNFGQHNALICGFQNASGVFIVTMDEDLQHHPNDLILLIQKQKENDYDVVYGHYPIRQHNTFRNFTSKLLKKTLEIGIPELHKDYSAFRLIKRDIAMATLEMQNSYTFLDGYLSWITTNVGSAIVRHQERFAGNSSYTLKKLIKHTINIFVTFSNLPIKLVTLLSLLFFIFTTSYSIIIIFKKLLFNDLIPGYTSIMVITGFGIGSILFGISVIGEYVHRINLKTTKRPNFIIKKIL